jgi:tetratricopeptide (TPR) repeat protein
MNSDGYYIFKLQKLKKFPKEYDHAIVLYNNKDYKKASDLLQDFINRGLENEDIYRIAYTSLILAKEYEKANALIKEFMSKYEPNADDYYNFGLTNSYINLEAEKENCFNKSLELNPNHPYTLNAIGYKLNTQNKFEEAIPYFDKAISQESNLAYAFNNRGHAKIEIGKLEEGLADIKESLKLDDSNSYVYRNLGIYNFKLGKYDEAKDLFMKAKQIDEQTELIEELLQKVTTHA